MLDLPIHAEVRYGGPIDADVILIAELEELLPGELRAVVCDNGVQYSKAMDDIKGEQHDLIGLDHGDRSGLYPLCKLVYGDKQVGIAPGHSFARSNQIELPDHERPCDDDRRECLGRQVVLLMVVLTPFIGAHNMFNVGYRDRPVEALLERVSD